MELHICLVYFLNRFYRCQGAQNGDVNQHATFWLIENLSETQNLSETPILAVHSLPSFARTPVDGPNEQGHNTNAYGSKQKRNQASESDS
jgi:hypothetical protein